MSWSWGTAGPIFSGKDGAAQYVAFWEGCGKPFELPPIQGKASRGFLYQGFYVGYEPMI